MDSDILQAIGALKTQTAVAILVPWLIKWLQKVHWAPLTATTDRLNRGASVLIAMLSASGIGVVYDQPGGQLIVSGLSQQNLISFFWAAGQQFLLFEGVYRAAWKQPKPPA